MPPRVFLDANILFSAALGGEVWDAIWAVAEKGRVLLLTSPYCLLEAQENLWCKRPSALTALEERLALVEVVEEAKPEPWMEGLLPQRTSRYSPRRWRQGPGYSSPGTPGTSAP